MNLLTSEQLEKLTTKRLLAYKNVLMKIHDGPNTNDCGMCHHNDHLNKTSPEWQSTYAAVKCILASREHVEK